MEYIEERIHKSNDMEQKKLANLNNREKTDWKIKYKEQYLKNQGDQNNKKFNLASSVSQ